VSALAIFDAQWADARVDIHRHVDRRCEDFAERAGVAARKAARFIGRSLGQQRRHHRNINRRK
jgi:hypothetical protein